MRKLLKAIAVGAVFVNGNAIAVPTLLDPNATLSIFDTGGLLDFANNGGFTLGGLEVDSSGTVFVLGASGAVGEPEHDCLYNTLPRSMPVGATK